MKGVTGDAFQNNNEEVQTLCQDGPFPPQPSGPVPGRMGTSHELQIAPFLIAESLNSAIPEKLSDPGPTSLPRLSKKRERSARAKTLVPAEIPL